MYEFLQKVLKVFVTDPVTGTKYLKLTILVLNLSYKIVGFPINS